MAFASRSRRSRKLRSDESFSGRTLMATVRSSRVSRARYTSPMPPAPSAVWISYGPSLVPAVSAICARHYSPNEVRYSEIGTIPGSQPLIRYRGITCRGRLRSRGVRHAQLGRLRGTPRRTPKTTWISSLRFWNCQNRRALAECDHIESEIRAVNLALSHYRAALELEKDLSTRGDN